MTTTIKGREHVPSVTRLACCAASIALAWALCLEAAGPPAGGAGPGPDEEGLLAQMARAHQGESVDLNGDGKADARTETLADGRVIRRFDLNQDGRPERYEETDKSGNVRVVFDEDSDGRPDREFLQTVGPPVRRVVTSDADSDGAMDHRETQTFNLQKREVHVLTETLDAGGRYQKLDEYTVPAVRHAAAAASGCDGNRGFPSKEGPALRWHNITIPYDGGGGRCTRQQAEKLLKAHQCAMGSGLSCLLEVNPELGYRLYRTFSREELTVGCGNTCAGSGASTQEGIFFPGQGDARSNYNAAATVDRLSDKDLCSAVLHEMLHWAGGGYTKDHDNGEDVTYSCGRYCGGCSSYGVGSPGSNTDCARCAGSSAAKRLCGVEERFEEIPLKNTHGIGEGTFSMCHARNPMACMLGGCEKAKGIRKYYCDGQEVTGAALYKCCETCPENCKSGGNNADCAQWQNVQLGNSCKQKPPHCP